MSICPNCDADVPSGASQCPKCSTDFTAIRKATLARAKDQVEKRGILHRIAAWPQGPMGETEVTFRGVTYKKPTPAVYKPREQKLRKQPPTLASAPPIFPRLTDQPREKPSNVQKEDVLGRGLEAIERGVQRIDKPAQRAIARYAGASHPEPTTPGVASKVCKTAACILALLLTALLISALLAPDKNQCGEKMSACYDKCANLPYPPSAYCSHACDVQFTSCETRK